MRHGAPNGFNPRSDRDGGSGPISRHVGIGHFGKPRPPLLAVRARIGRRFNAPGLQFRKRNVGPVRSMIAAERGPHSKKQPKPASGPIMVAIGLRDWGPVPAQVVRANAKCDAADLMVERLIPRPALDVPKTAAGTQRPARRPAATLASSSPGALPPAVCVDRIPETRGASDHRHRPGNRGQETGDSHLQETDR